MNLLLASKSETRRTMLAAAGLNFALAESSLDEDQAKAGLAGAGFDARDLAEMLAEMKARGAPAPVDAWVIGADQILEQDDGSLLDKPVSRDDALAQLRALRGRTHFLHSAAVVVRGGARLWGHTESVALTMRETSNAFLESYLDREYEAIRFSVGGYQIEGPGVQLFERVEGSHFAILGLPLLPLLDFLRDQQVIAR